MLQLCFITTLVSICLLFTLSACANNSFSKINNEEVKESESKIEIDDNTKESLVVYFSETGNTESVANTIAAVIDADIYEIIPEQPYSNEDLDYGNEDSRTSIEMNDPNSRPEIGGQPLSLENYQTIYLGYPIWWGEAPRIISTFVESYDFTDITVIPFCTSGGSDIGNSDDNLKELSGTGNWKDGKRFGANVTQEEIQSWIEEIDK